jgi:DNA replicative helicase MCM subunit Mcm2 (Cdc46/Mcm family)
VGVLASANPVYGCYNKSKSFKENTKISNAILSRFDLIFLLLDKPDPDHDKKLSEHIIKVLLIQFRFTIKREKDHLNKKKCKF